MPERGFEPPDPRPPAPAVDNGNGGAGGNGSRLAMVEQEKRDDVARLARAIATSHVDVVRPADLAAARDEIEGAFTQQLAVALYELMAASNARFAAAEDHIHQRVNEAIEGHTGQLTASLDAYHRAATAMAEALRADVDSLHGRLVGPVEGLAAFQRELRHDVGRLTDVVSAQGRASAERSQDETEEWERHDQRLVKAAEDLSDVAVVLATMKDDLTTLREDVAQLRATVDERGPNGRKPRRWGRSR